MFVWSVLRESNTLCRLGGPLLATEKNAKYSGRKKPRHDQNTNSVCNVKR